MNPMAKLDLLQNQTLAAQQGLNLLREIRIDLYAQRSAASKWAIVAVSARAVLIPMNVILNTFQVKSAKGIYRTFAVRLLAASKENTQTDGYLQILLQQLKQAIIAELKAARLEDYIPVVNIIIGLTEDSVALWRTMKLIQDGSIEIDSQVARLERNIDALQQQVRKLGIDQADIIRRIQVHVRTA